MHRREIIEAIDRQIAALNAIKANVPAINCYSLASQAESAVALMESVIRPMQEANAQGFDVALGVVAEFSNADLTDGDLADIREPEALTDFFTDVETGVEELRNEYA